VIHLRDEDVLKKLEWPALLKALEQAFFERDLFEVPERVVLGAPQDGVYLTMPCASADGWFGVKQVSVLPGNAAYGRPTVQAYYTLFGPEGTPVLGTEATLLTRARTAGVSAVAAKYLAPADARTLLVVGTGSLAPWMAEAHLQVRRYERVLVWGRNMDRAEELVMHLQLRLDLPTPSMVHVARDLPQAAAEADVITVATTAKAPVLQGGWLHKGQHLDLVGAFTPAMAEVDADGVKRSRVFVDDLDACREEAGDLIQAQEHGWSFDQTHGDLTAVVRTQAAREDQNELTLFKSVGLALEDLVTARLLL
jgi:alanine dehydrogenase